MSGYGVERSELGLDIVWDARRSLRSLTSRGRRRGLQMRPDAMKTRQPQYPFTRLGKQLRVDEPNELMSLERVRIRSVDMHERRPHRCDVVVTLKTRTKYVVASGVGELVALAIVDELRAELLLG